MYKSIQTIESFGQMYFVKPKIDESSYTTTEKNSD